MQEALVGEAVKYVAVFFKKFYHCNFLFAWLDGNV